ncbi:MAG: hypothetical protein U9N84_01740 [Actinomycetota bacterium]|nr:hypothetical protein [Actinomycetota bacterium]
MRTQMMIMLIVSAVFLAGVVTVIGLVWWLGIGTAAIVIVVAAALVILLFPRVIAPWYRRWGASDDEVTMTMPGDELIANATSFTRAIGIAAPPTPPPPLKRHSPRGGTDRNPLRYVPPGKGAYVVPSSSPRCL